VLAGGTLASRLTGFVRVLVVAYVLGVGPISDAFNVANGAPNIVYDLLLGGILSATLIPVFVEHLDASDPEQGRRAISAVLSAIVVALVAMSALLWLAAPYVIRFYLVLNSTRTGPAERKVATDLLRYFAPQVFFLGAIVVSTALLNARRRFGTAALSPVLNNLVAIGALLATKALAGHTLSQRHLPTDVTLVRFDHDATALAVLGLGTTAGYAAQLLLQLPAMWRAGLVFRPAWDLGHPAVKKVASLSSWLFGVVIANQAALAVVSILALRRPGGLTVYQYAYQFFLLPYSLIAVSVASAVMPNLALRWARRDLLSFEAQLVVGLRSTLALMIPLSLVYLAVAGPLVNLALHHGQVQESNAHLIGSTLELFAVGLPGFSGFFLLMRAYQAMQQTRTMFLIYLVENGLTLVLALALVGPLGVPGLAFAWVAPYSVCAVAAAYLLRRRLGSLGGVYTLRTVVRSLIAGGAAAVAAALVGRALPGEGDLELALRLLLELGAALGVYAGAAWTMQIKELNPLLRYLRGLRRP